LHAIEAVRDSGWLLGLIYKGDTRRAMEMEQIKQRIIELQIEHRDLDEAIDRLASQPGVDEVKLRRLKKRKLQIKDSIALLQMQFVPDVPA
jgi:hypothetical protein